MHGIERDNERFRQIVRGKIKQNLRKYMSQDGIEIFGKDGKHKITVPIPHIDLPRFIHGRKGGGVGQGDAPGPGKGTGKQPGGGEGAGDNPADNALEVDVSLEEIADLLSEELKLPEIQPKGKSEISIDSNKYRTLRTTGPESLRHTKKTFLNALKRSIASDEYDPDDPVIIPIKEDKRYRAAKPVTIPQYQAVVFFLMDVSGSMGPHQKEMARLTSFWIDLWLRHHYDFIKSRYIIHNYTAKEVDRHTFFHTMESGGTRIASAYELCRDLIKKDYHPAEWNIYIFQYSDGDDWGGATSAALNIINDLLEVVNQIAYCQVREHGDFKGQLEKRFGEKKKNLVITTAFEKEQIFDAIKDMFQAGN